MLGQPDLDLHCPSRVTKAQTYFPPEGLGIFPFAHVDLLANKANLHSISTSVLRRQAYPVYGYCTSIARRVSTGHTSITFKLSLYGFDPFKGVKSTAARQEPVFIDFIDPVFAL